MFSKLTCNAIHGFSSPLFSKSLLTEGWCFAGILGRASLTERRIYCTQTIDTVRPILCFTCRPVHPLLDISPWPLRSLLVDLEILLKISKHLKTLWAALDMNDLSSKKISTEKHSSCNSGFQKTLSSDMIRCSPQIRAFLCLRSFQFYPWRCNFKKRNWTTI